MEEGLKFPLFFFESNLFFGFLILCYLTYDIITERGNMGGYISHCLLHLHDVID